jgi:hypothetical protein
MTESTAKKVIFLPIIPKAVPLFSAVFRSFIQLAGFTSVIPRAMIPTF